MFNCTISSKINQENKNLTTMLLSRSETITKCLSTLSIFVVALLITGCGIFGSGSSGPPLDGDLSYEVEGAEGETVYISRTAFMNDEANFSTIGSVTSPGSGDLEDGDYDGYILQASPLGGGEPDITLRLMSNDKKLGETSTITDDGIFLIEKGDIPDLSDLQ